MSNCEYCGKRITKGEEKYGDAIPTQRKDGKIVGRAAHIECIQAETERLASEAEDEKARLIESE